MFELGGGETFILSRWYVYLFCVRVANEVEIFQLFQVLLGEGKSRQMVELTK